MVALALAGIREEKSRPGLAFEGEHSDSVDDDFANDDSPWEVSSDSDEGHAHQVVRSDAKQFSATSKTPDPPSPTTSGLNLIQFIVSCLWKLPIRRPAPLDRMKDRETAEASVYQPFDIMHVRNKFPILEDTVAVRLGKAISMRRQLLRYRKNHTDALQNQHVYSGRQVVDSRSFTEDEMHLPTASLVASTRYTQDTKATTLKLAAHNLALAESDTLYAQSVSTYTSSEVSDQTDSETPLKFPHRPIGDSGKSLQSFVCPYCQTIQTISTDRKWRYESPKRI
jgi:hypothetical protein